MRVAVDVFLLLLTLPFFASRQRDLDSVANNGSSRLLTVMIDVLQSYSRKKPRESRISNVATTTIVKN